MRAYIFDQYGYYEDDEYASEFDYQGWHFKLEKTDKSEDELKDLNEYVKKMEQVFRDSGVNIVKNRDNNYLSKADFGTCVLISVKNRRMELNDLMQMHVFFKSENQDTNYTLKEMAKLWEDKIDLLEEKIIPAFKINDYAYEEVMSSTIFAIGLAENALQYLAEIALDLGDDIENLTLTHKRLYKFSSYEFFSPLNLIIDSPMRDLAELYKAELIDNEKLLQILKYYSPSKKDISILLARILFPTTFLDNLDDYYVVRKDVKLQILEFKEKASDLLKKISQLERTLVNTYHIRPIKWLN